MATTDAQPRELILRTLNGDRAAVKVLDVCFAQSNRARRIGITGPPGAGHAR